MADKKLVIELDIDSRGAVTGLKTANGAAIQFDSTLIRTEKKAKSFSQTLSVAMGNILAGFAMNAVRSFGTVQKAMFDMATESAETESKFQTTFGAASAEVDAFGEKVANTAGLTQTEFRNIASVAGAITRGMGATEQAAAGFSKEMIALAGDLQSFHNVPIDETFAALRSGLTGETEPLKRFGIVLTAAETQLRALSDTGKTSAKDLTQLELAQARMNLMYEKAGVAVGDLARTQDSTANTTRRVVAEMREHAESLSKEFLPVYGMLAQSASDFLEQNEEGISNTIKAVGNAARQTVFFVQEYIATVVEIAQVIHENRRVVALVATAWVAYRHGLQLATLAQKVFNVVAKANPLGLVVTAVTILIGLWVQFKDKIMEAGAVLLEWAASAIDAFGSLFDKLEPLARFVGGPLERAFDAVSAKIDGASAALRSQAASLRESAEAFRETRAEATAAGNQAEDAGAQFEEMGKKAVTALDKAQDAVKKMREELSALEENTTAFVAHQLEAEELEKKLQAVRERIAGIVFYLQNGFRRGERDFTFFDVDEVKDFDLAAQEGFGNMNKSLDQVNMRLSVMRGQFGQATSDEQRARIAAVIAELEKLKDEMEEATDAAVSFDEALQATFRDTGMQVAEMFGNAFGEMVVGVEDNIQTLRVTMLQALAEVARAVARLLFVRAALAFASQQYGKGVALTAAATAATALGSGLSRRASDLSQQRREEDRQSRPSSTQRSSGPLGQTISSGTNPLARGLAIPTSDGGLSKGVVNELAAIKVEIARLNKTIPQMRPQMDFQQFRQVQNADTNRMGRHRT